MGTRRGNRLVSATATKRPSQPGLRLLGGRLTKPCVRGPPERWHLSISSITKMTCRGHHAQNALSEGSPAHRA
jgi:hypothetical protein